jgi:hypothetical protein
MGRYTTLIGALVLLLSACSGSASPAPTAVPATPLPATATPVAPSPVAVAPTPTATSRSALTGAVTFDGQKCTYAGPAVLPRGAEDTLTFTNTAAALKGSRGAALVVAPVVDGTAWERILADAASTAATNVPDWLIEGANGSEVRVLYPEEAAVGKTMWFVATRNLYLLMCATAPEETDKGYPAILLTVLQG